MNVNVAHTVDVWVDGGGVDVGIDGIGTCDWIVLIGGGCIGELGMCIGEIVDVSC